MSVESAVLLQFGYDATRRKSGGLTEDTTGRDGSCVAVVTIGNNMSFMQMLSLQGSEKDVELLLMLQKNKNQGLIWRKKKQ